MNWIAYKAWRALAEIGEWLMWAASEKAASNWREVMRRNSNKKGW